MSKKGKSIIFISSELTELIAISDRIAIVSNGEINKIINKKDLISNKREDATTEQYLQFLIQTNSGSLNENYEYN